MATTKKASKKVASKKSVEKKDKPLLKYEDKSAGQPEMVKIFDRLKLLMLPYEKGTIKVHGGSGGQISLISHKPIEVAGRKRSEVWFVSALIQKGYVGFYYMPIYGYKELANKIHPNLMKCLKGKACFHIKKNDDELFTQIKEAIQIGYVCYKKLDWVE
jgi:hypothetical protein